MSLAKSVGVVLGILALGGCAKPIPAARLAYVGTWQGTGMNLRILADGRVNYSRQSGNSSTTINAPLQEFMGDNFKVGVGPIGTTFVVSAAPHRVDGEWRMVVDGVELHKVP